MTCDQWDVVAVPFPFSESSGAKRRPAVVLSGRTFNNAGHVVLAMVTTQQHRPWPGDTPVADIDRAGLPRPCIVRLKLFTLDARLIARRLGTLGTDDIAAVRASLRTYLSCD
ncbi:type II toxin-antitoxin system PemK/MazF family toxin [Candidatus Fermentibacteria bacterium]|nr:type II toxin-antitoxin system PemK/MazF family toxin [Candidatus Fermentibacteria bacterium]